MQSDEQHPLLALQHVQTQMQALDVEIDAVKRDIAAEHATLVKFKAQHVADEASLKLALVHVAACESRLAAAQTTRNGGSICDGEQGMHDATEAIAPCTFAALERLTDGILSGSLRKELDAARDEPAAAHAAALASAHTRLGEQHATVVALVARIAAARAELAKVTQLRCDADARSAALASRRREVEATLAAERQVCVELTTQLASQKAHAAQLARLRAELDEIKTENEELEAYRAALREKIAAMVETAPMTMTAAAAVTVAATKKSTTVHTQRGNAASSASAYDNVFQKSMMQQRQKK